MATWRRVRSPPFRAPTTRRHPASIVGGGYGHPVQGELSLAHHGVLFMDEVVKDRVLGARRRQADRGSLNGHMRRRELDADPPDPASRQLLERALEGGILTGRGADRARRVARTIADLAGADQVGEDHLAEALAYRRGL